MSDIYIPAAAGQFAWVGHFRVPGFGSGNYTTDHLTIRRVTIVAWRIDPTMDPPFAQPVFPGHIDPDDDDTYVLDPGSDDTEAALQAWKRSIVAHRISVWEAWDREQSRAR